MAKCAFCDQELLPGDATERVTGRGPTEVRIHVRCAPTREFREHVPFNEPTIKKPKEREIREKKE